MYLYGAFAPLAKVRHCTILAEGVQVSVAVRFPVGDVAVLLVELGRGGGGGTPGGGGGVEHVLVGVGVHPLPELVEALAIGTRDALYVEVVPGETPAVPEKGLNPPAVTLIVYPPLVMAENW
jgi:hypothetical protein